MIQKQSPSAAKTLYQIYSSQQIIQEILRIKHHTHLIDYRYQLNFQRFFGNYRQKFGNKQIQLDKVSKFQSQTQMLINLYKMDQLKSIFRSIILNRVKNDCIMPILRKNQRQNHIIKFFEKRWQKSIGYQIESNTLPTQSSQHKEKLYKILKVEPYKIQTKKRQNPFPNKNSPRQLLNKVTNDLSKVIQKSYIYQQKDMKIYSKINQLERITSKKKQKWQLIQNHVNKIKENTQENFQRSLVSFDDPQENYGFKKYKKTETKFQQKSSKRKNLQQSNQNKNSMKSLNNKNIRQLKKNSLSPLTSQLPKIKQLWRNNLDKSSRSSLKFQILSHKKLKAQLRLLTKQSQDNKLEKKILKSPIKIINKKR